MTLLELIHLLKKHLKLVIVLPLACALIMGVYSLLFMRNTYTASTSMYVLVTQDTTSSSSLSSDLSASQMVSNDVADLLKSDRVKSNTASALGLKSLDGYKISVTSTTTSRVISLQVEGTDPSAVADVANKMAQTVSDIAHEVMSVSSVNIIDQAVAPDAPSGPKRPLYVAVALLGGFFVAVALVVVGDMLDTKVRNQEEVEEFLGIPVIGRIPAIKEGR